MRLGVVRQYSFEAAHVLPWHAGKCSRLHGHSYRLVVTVTGELDHRGVVCEFSELDKKIESGLLFGESGLDHSDLNLTIENPTAERIALHIGDRLTSMDIAWTRIELWETLDGAAVIER